MTETDLFFPYMFWAQRESWAAPYSLAQSGMPAPEADWLADAFRLELAQPWAEELPALEGRLAELFGVPPERVLATAGASSAMAILAARYFRGSRVVTEIPSYDPFRALPRLFGADLRVLERHPEDGWRLDPAAVEGALADASPAHAFLCTPHNPTGAVTPPGDLARIAAACERAGGVLIAGEVYMEFAPPAERSHAFALAPNAISIGSLTKAYGLGPLRIGWIVLGEGVAGERDALKDITFLGYVDPPTPALRAGRIALDNLERLLQPLRRFERESRPLLERWLAEMPGVNGTLGPYGLCAFPAIAGVADTRALSRFLADEFGVTAVPGEFFGRAGHLRVSYAVPEATLVEGLDRLTRGIEAFRAAAPENPG